MCLFKSNDKIPILNFITETSLEGYVISRLKQANISTINFVEKIRQ